MRSASQRAADFPLHPARRTWLTYWLRRIMNSHARRSVASCQRWLLLTARVRQSRTRSSAVVTSRVNVREERRKRGISSTSLERMSAISDVPLAATQDSIVRECRNSAMSVVDDLGEKLYRPAIELLLRTSC